MCENMYVFISVRKDLGLQFKEILEFLSKNYAFQLKKTSEYFFKLEFGHISV